MNSFTLNDYVIALKQQVLKLEQKPIIIGHSMGGMVLQKYLETETCEQAILLASIPVNGALNAAAQFMTKGFAYRGLLTMNLYKLVNSPQKARWAFFSEEITDAELTEYTSNLSGESYFAFLQLLWPGVKVNNHKSVPMLVVGSDSDRFVSVDETVKTARKFDANFKIFNRIGHSMMLDKGRDEVSKYIADWIDVN